MDDMFGKLFGPDGKLLPVNQWEGGVITNDNPATYTNESSAQDVPSLEELQESLEKLRLDLDGLKKRTSYLCNPGALVGMEVDRGEWRPTLWGTRVITDPKVPLHETRHVPSWRDPLHRLCCRIERWSRKHGFISEVSSKTVAVKTELYKVMYELILPEPAK